MTPEHLTEGQVYAVCFIANLIGTFTGFFLFSILEFFKRAYARAWDKLQNYIEGYRDHIAEIKRAEQDYLNFVNRGE